MYILCLFQLYVGLGMMSMAYIQICFVSNIVQENGCGIQISSWLVISDYLLFSSLLHCVAASRSASMFDRKKYPECCDAVLHDSRPWGLLQNWSTKPFCWKIFNKQVSLDSWGQNTCLGAKSFLHRQTHCQCRSMNAIIVIYHRDWIPASGGRPVQPVVLSKTTKKRSISNVTRFTGINLEIKPIVVRRLVPGGKASPKICLILCNQQLVKPCLRVKTRGIFLWESILRKSMSIPIVSFMQS